MTVTLHSINTSLRFVNLRYIRSMLSENMSKSVAVALVSSCLDYANLGTSTTNLHKIQRVQDTLAKIVLNDSITIRYCSSPTSLAFFQSASPSTLSSLINFNNPSRPLRFSSLKIHVSFTTKAIGRKASGSQLQRFGILFHKTSGYYHPLVLLNAVSKLTSFSFPASHVHHLATPRL